MFEIRLVGARADEAIEHDLQIAFKDGVVAGAQNIGEGLAAGFDDSSKRQMASIYGQDVSCVMKTVAALQTGAAIGGAIGAGKLAAAGAMADGKAVKATAKEAGELLGRAGVDDLLRGAPGDERFIALMWWRCTWNLSLRSSAFVHRNDMDAIL